MNEEELKLLKRFEEWIENTEAEMRYLRKNIKEIKEKHREALKT